MIAAAIMMMMVRLRRSSSVASTSARTAPATSPSAMPLDDRVLDRSDHGPREQERDDRPDREEDHHPPALPRQPEGERHEGDRENDQQDHQQVEDPHRRLRREQPVGGHQLDRPERRRERDVEGGVEALGEDVGGVRRAQVRQRDVGRDDPVRLQLVQRGTHHREQVEHDIAVDHDQGLGLAAQDPDDPLMGEPDRLDQRRVDLRVLERDLQPLVDPALEGEGHRAGERLHQVGQPCLETILDIEGFDDLRADPIGDRIRDGRFLRRLGDQLGEPVRVQRDLVGPDPDGRHEDRDAGEHERDPRQDPPASSRGWLADRRDPHVFAHHHSPSSKSTVTPDPTLAGRPRRFSPGDASGRTTR